ncbi:hypothetical protein PO909_033561 [Leuciscus waleckii]
MALVALVCAFPKLEETLDSAEENCQRFRNGKERLPVCMRAAHVVMKIFEYWNAQLKDVFEYPAGGKDVSTQLLHMSQGNRTAAEYAIEFRTLAAQSGCNDVSLKAVFQQSLNAELQTELACKALIDFGAALNLIHKDLIVKFNIPTQPCTPPIKISAVNNAPIGDGITQQTQPLRLHVGIFHQEAISFYVINSPRHEIILGFSWSSVHDPVISWRHGELTHGSEFCLNHCMLFSAIQTCFTTSIESPDIKQTTKIPTCYNDLIEVFSKTKPMQLLLHRQWDCAIDLLPNAMPPKSKVYLSHSETQAMEEYIEEAMNSGFIRPSTSPAAAGFFFVEKKDGGLHPCIDYRGLNNVTVKFRYPLPLVPAALEQLREAKIYTKLDLRSAYNLV